METTYTDLSFKPLYDVSPEVKSHFLNIFNILISDAKIEKKELEFLYQIGIERGVDKNAIDFIISNPHKVRFVEPKSTYDKIAQLYDFARMVVVDGIIDPREISIFTTLAKNFHFEEENISELIDFLIEEAKKNTLTEKINEIVKLNL